MNKLVSSLTIFLSSASALQKDTSSKRQWKGKITASPSIGLGTPFDQQTGQYAQYMGFYSGDYYGQAYVGTPEQSPTGNYWSFDTQSSLTVVPIKDSTVTGWFDCEDSATCVDDGQTFNITTEAYVASCTGITDNVCLTSIEDEYYTCADALSFCGATALNSAASHSGYYGVLGLGWSRDEADTNFAEKLGQDSDDYEPIVYLNLGWGSFFGDDFIAFGYNQYEAPMTAVGYYVLDSTADRWYLTVDDFTYGATSTTTAVTGNAKIATASPYIEIPESEWKDIQDELEAVGFICHNDRVTDRTLCATSLDCSEVATAFHGLNMKIKGDTVDSVDVHQDFKIAITPEYWLFQNPESGYCESQIVPNTNSDKDNFPYVFGGPFFRSYVMSLEYDTGNMTVYSRDDISPITPSLYPTENKTAILTIPMTATSLGSYYTNLFIGDSAALQNTTQAAVDTMLQMTSIPASNCSGCADNWYSEDACPGCLGPNVVPHSYTLPEFTYKAKTYMAATTCISGTDSGSDDLFCVGALQVDLVDEVTAMTDAQPFQAAFGFGQPLVYSQPLVGNPTLNYNSFDTNFIFQTYLQSPNAEPFTCFNYYWDSSIDAVGDLKASTVTLGDGVDACFNEHHEPVLSTSKNAWSVDAKNMTFGTQEATFDDKVTAFIGSDYEFIGIDSTYWHLVRNELKLFGFDCVNKPCIHPASCDYIAHFVPEAFVLGGDDKQISIPQTAYMLNDAEDHCISLLAPSEGEYFVLGTPFFRTYDVGLDFNTTSIYIEDGNKQGYSPVVVEWGPYNSDYDYIATQDAENWSQTFGTFFVGDDHQGGQMTMAFSTQSEWTVVPSKLCKECYDNWFDEYKSGTNIEIYDDSKWDLCLDSACVNTVHCKLASGQVCLNKEDPGTTCVTSFYFCLADSLNFNATANMPSAILGMGMYKQTLVQNYPLMNYLINLQSWNVLYDFNFDYQDQTSFVQFGVNDSRLDAADFIAQDMLQTDMWGMEIVAMEFDKQGGKTENAFCPLDSNRNTIGIPQLLYNVIVNQWVSDLNFEYIYYDGIGQSLYTLDSSCPDAVINWPDLVMQWNGTDEAGNAFSKTLAIPATIYFTTNANLDKCILSITYSEDAPNACWLGSPFFRNYNFIFDYQVNSVSMFHKEVRSPVDPSDVPITTDLLTYTFDRTVDGQYLYNMGIGTPMQQSGGIAFSTSSSYTVVPSSSCINCDNDWYDESASSTYYDNDSRYTLTAGLWGGLCEDTNDVFYYTATNFIQLDFCAVVYNENNFLHYNGAYGFGLPQGQNQCVNSVLPCALWNYDGFAPYAVFNYTDTQGEVSIGDWTTDKQVWGSGVSMLNSNQWAANVTQISYVDHADEQVDPWYPSLLDSNFPYITLPPNSWSAFQQKLDIHRWVCFRSAFQEVQVCETSDPCSKFADWEALNITISLDGEKADTMTMGPDQYLGDTPTGGCQSLLTPADPTYEMTEWSRLGQPFFRQFIIQFNYENNEITFYLNQ